MAKHSLYILRVSFRVNQHHNNDSFAVDLKDHVIGKAGEFRAPKSLICDGVLQWKLLQCFEHRIELAIKAIRQFLLNCQIP